MLSWLVISAVVALFGARLVAAHGSQVPIVDPNANWMTRHMAEEHHITNFDHISFFTIHDFNANGRWEIEEILRTYGLFDESNQHVSAGQVESFAQRLLGLLDLDDDGSVQRAEWDQFVRRGGELPDLGTGPGHHGDDEYEYEIHHWEKFHNENSPIEELNHPEDLAHFKKHEQLEEAQHRLDRMNAQPVIEANIPEKFRRPVDNTVGLENRS